MDGENDNALIYRERKKQCDKKQKHEFNVTTTKNKKVCTFLGFPKTVSDISCNMVGTMRFELTTPTTPR